jgi:hypothetical protein
MIMVEFGTSAAQSNAHSMALATALKIDAY